MKIEMNAYIKMWPLLCWSKFKALCILGGLQCPAQTLLEHHVYLLHNENAMRKVQYSRMIIQM